MNLRISLRRVLTVAATLSLVQLGVVANAQVPEQATAKSLAPTAKGRVATARTVGKKRTLKIRVEHEVVVGDNFMLKGKYSEAADSYREALNRNSRSVPATVGLGMALAKQFKLDGANEEFDKALALDSQNAMAHSGKALVLFNRLQSSSGTVIKSRDALLHEAESEVKQGIATDPGMPEAHNTLGNIYKEEGQLDQAISEYSEATKLDPQYSEAFAGLGIAKMTQGDLVGAATALKRAISLNSGNSTAHYGLGRTYLKQGLLDDAQKELNTSLYQYPNSAPAHLAMAEVYNGQGNTVAAIQQCQESIRIKPENPDAYIHIADIREQRGDLEHSIAELRSGLAMMPNNTELHQRVADDSLKLEKLDDAIKEYRGVLETDPRNAAAAKGLTRAYYMKSNKEATGAFFVSNEYESARDMIDQAVRMNPNDLELRLAQAKLRALSGEKVDLTQIGRPTNEGERIAYAEALLAQNRFTEADQQMAQVVASATDAKQTFAVGDLALMIKDLPTADAAYRKAASFPGASQRSKRGLELVGQAKESARQDLTLANDLSRRKQLASAVDKYHSAIFGNPKVPDARVGLAQTLERLSPHTSKDYREAVVQYKAYLALSPTLPTKQQEQINKRITNLESKAYKLELKEKKVQ